MFSRERVKSINKRVGQLEKQLDRFLRRHPRLGRNVFIARSAVVLGDVTLGDHSSIWKAMPGIRRQIIFLPGKISTGIYVKTEQ